MSGTRVSPTSFLVDNIKFAKQQGLVPTVVQSTDGTVLTLAFSNKDSLRQTLETGQGWYWSRSRNALWRKGETSGNTQQVVDIQLDCDNDALLFVVEQQGPACHTGDASCFGPRRFCLDALYDVVRDRKTQPKEGSYTSSLFMDRKGVNKILEKLGEEAIEVILAAKDGKRKEIIAEMADLFYFAVVLLAEKDIQVADIMRELEARR